MSHLNHQKYDGNIESKANLFSLMYRSTSSTKHLMPMRIFLDELPEHITTLLTENNPIILGDINIPWNKEDGIDRESLPEIMDLYNLKQYVLFQTQKQGNTLGWIISREIYQTIVQ